MKIIITEKQYNKLTEDKLQKLCYTVWNQQKKRGEEPYIDDIISDISLLSNALFSIELFIILQ